MFLCKGLFALVLLGAAFSWEAVFCCDAGLGLLAGSLVFGFWYCGMVVLCLGVDLCFFGLGFGGFCRICENE